MEVGPLGNERDGISALIRGPWENLTLCHHMKIWGEGLESASTLTLASRIGKSKSDVLSTPHPYPAAYGALL